MACSTERPGERSSSTCSMLTLGLEQIFAGLELVLRLVVEAHGGGEDERAVDDVLPLELRRDGIEVGAAAATSTLVGSASGPGLREPLLAEVEGRAGCRARPSTTIIRKKFSTTTSGWRAFCERGGGGGAASGCSACRGLFGLMRRRGCCGSPATGIGHVRSGETTARGHVPAIGRLPARLGRSDSVVSSSAAPGPSFAVTSRSPDGALTPILAKSGEASQTRRKTSEALVPPKPKELESATSICFSLAPCAARGRSASRPTGCRG